LVATALLSMRRPHVPDSHARLQPAGQRWGFGAHSVLPYLAFALQSRAGEESGDSIRNPVFPQMENILPVLPRQH
jgi:hypothetical protein